MKRVISVLIVFVVVLSVTACWSESMPESPVKWMEEDTFYFEYTYLGEHAFIQGRIASHNGNIVTITDSASGKIRTVIIDDVFYVFYDEQEAYAIVPEFIRDEHHLEGFAFSGEPVKIGEGIDEFNEKTLPYVEYGYNRNGVSMRFFIEDDRIYGGRYMGETKKDMLITNISNEFTEEMFDIRIDYSKTYLY